MRSLSQLDVDMTNLHAFGTIAMMEAALEGLTRETMLEGLTAPIHPGALKYYKEAGLMK